MVARAARGLARSGREGAFRRDSEGDNPVPPSSSPPSSSKKHRRLVANSAPPTGASRRDFSPISTALESALSMPESHRGERAFRNAEAAAFWKRRCRPFLFLFSRRSSLLACFCSRSLAPHLHVDPLLLLYFLLLSSTPLAHRLSLSHSR